MTRIGFLYNHFTTHQVLHTAPVAFELSTNADTEVHVLASCDRQLRLAQRIGRAWPDHRVIFSTLQLARGDRALAALGCRMDIGFKRRTLRANRALLQSMDALVVPERTSAILRDFTDLRQVKLILIPHGAGDRAIGYERRNAVFDLVLVAGEKCRRRLIDEAGVPAQRIRIIGYPKFDVPSVTDGRPSLFAAERPTVLYNPHFDPRHSSWPKLGIKVLDHFAAQSQYNLIFAPHVMLYRRPARHKACPLEPYQSLPHMHIDVGSDHCVDMTYTRLADIYLGDASSQIYEFIVKPRPAVFLNARRLDTWETDPNYRHWSLGTVIDDLDDLPRALQGPPSEAMMNRQRDLARATFDCGPESASQRGASSIIEFLYERGRAPVAQRARRLQPPAISSSGAMTLGLPDRSI